MRRADILDILNQHKVVLSEQFDVGKIALFGSAVRDELAEESDIDILVEFSGPATSNLYFGLQFYLEDLLNRPIDLVTTKALRKELKPYIYQEAVYV